MQARNAEPSAQEEALRADRDRLQGVLDSISEGFLLLDADFKVADVNAAGLRMDGRTAAELIGRSHWDAFPASVGTPVEAAYRKAMAERVPVELAHRYLDAEAGVDLWLDIRAYPSADGALALFYRDISERKQAEAALRTSNERFQAAVGAVQGVLWTNDAAGRMLGEQPGWAALTGQSLESYQGYGWAEAVHPDDRQATLDSWNEAVAQRKPFVFEHRLRRGDGQWRRFSIRAIPILDDGGEIAEWVGVHTDVTEQRQAEAALRRSEERFRLMADAVPQIIWITDADGRAEFFNKNWTDYTGAPYQPATAAEVAADHVHPDDGPATMAAFEAAKRSGGAFVVEHRIRSRSGDHRWFLVRAQPYRDPMSGEITRWFGASVDIHDRKLAEQRLQELNQTLEERVAETAADLDRVWRNATDMFVVIDEDGVFRRVNPATSAILGWTADEMIGRSVFDLIHPDDAAASVSALQQARADVLPTFENRYRTKDGALRTISWVAAPEGPMIYAYGRDITAEKEQRARLEAAETARREADALYRAYFENTPEALFVVSVSADGEFVVEQVNSAHEASVGLRLEDIEGEPIEAILPPEVADRVLETYRQVVASGEIHQYREIFDLGGDPKHWDTSIMPVHNAEGRVVRLIGSSRDVTRQVVAEEALRQSQKMEAIGQLTGGVAHDFNNLLTPIMGSLDMLQRRGVGNERERRLIAGGLQAADRAKTLVHRLLAFARRQPLQSVAVDVAALVTGMAELVASTTGPQIRVVVDAPEDLPPANADPGQLEMALLNLAVNARDAMPDGGTLRMSVSLEHLASGHRSGLRPGAYVQISIADTGIGMDEATLARAIEPFFSTKGVGKGTGLGLSMVHGLASQLGGALTIRSRPGLGTNIELWLPQSTAPLHAPAAAPQDAPEIAARGRALLVDDDALVRMSTADMLADLGYAVVEADSAEGAMGRVEAGEPFDILVTDHLMPGMTGADLARAVAALRGDLPVLVISGYAENEGIAPDLPRLTKPFRKDELAAMLAKL